MIISCVYGISVGLRVGPIDPPVGLAGMVFLTVRLLLVFVWALGQAGLGSRRKTHWSPRTRLIPVIIGRMMIIIIIYILVVH